MQMVDFALECAVTAARLFLEGVLAWESGPVAEAPSLAFESGGVWEEPAADRCWGEWTGQGE